MSLAERPITTLRRGYYCGTRDKNQIAHGRLQVFAMRSSRVRPRARKGVGEQERGGRTRNNRRADRTDEWDTTVEDVVRSIDGIVACNVN